VIEVHAPVDLTAEQLKGIEEAVEQCLVHNTLLHPPKIALKVAGLVAAKE